ncbi:MAG: hypothetical protein R6V43_10800 [Halopseudomonas sp.]
MANISKLPAINTPARVALRQDFDSDAVAHGVEHVAVEIGVLNALVVFNMAIFSLAAIRPKAGQKRLESDGLNSVGGATTATDMPRDPDWMRAYSYFRDAGSAS